MKYPSRILRNDLFRVICGVISLFAILINLVNIGLFIVSIQKVISISSFANETFVFLISVGDILVGINMALLFSYDIFLVCLVELLKLLDEFFHALRNPGFRKDATANRKDFVRQVCQ